MLKTMLVMSIKRKYDLNQLFFTNVLEAVIFVSSPTKITILILLKGIKIED